ncbi:type I-E CRISPR-associated protein Cse2/CasB [Thermoactinospora rubra]|uniref:type I-E CRISPR-associated protein Cse2/CasB n=1 Tax=Thermoactinospora rubra TaxID=1088767 RepID=UPI000A0FA275|nr:type I-E CRISPR-associated protein Cse2/CasB [Thermoactinospora rubra]
MADKADRYVTYLTEVFDREPGLRAAARRTLGRSIDDPMTRRADVVVARWLPEVCPRAVETAYYTVAALMASQPRNSAKPKNASSKESLGRTLGQAVRHRDLNESGVEKRLHLLCRQEVDSLHRHLPTLIRQLTAKDIQPDWAKLLVDLGRWGHSRDRVVKEWLQDYYRTARPLSNESDQESEDQ